MWKLSEHSNHEILRSQHLDTLITFAIKLHKVNKYMSHATKKNALKTTGVPLYSTKKSHHRYPLSFHKEAELG